MDVFILTLIYSLAACLVVGVVRDAFTHYKQKQHRKQVFRRLYSDILGGVNSDHSTL